MVVHLLWRRAYYGAWLPATFYAKTGDLRAQLSNGLGYVRAYAHHEGAILWLAALAVVASVVRNDARVRALAAMTFAYFAYVFCVGGDWMPAFRFMAPIEPFLYLLVEVGVMTLLERGDRAIRVTLALFVAFVVVSRARAVRRDRAEVLDCDVHHWRDVRAATEWLRTNERPDVVAAFDIGYLGYRTGWPIVDLVGLVTPAIAHADGGYSQKHGPAFVDAVFAAGPRYVILPSDFGGCTAVDLASERAWISGRSLVADPRFAMSYRLRARLPFEEGTAWCVFARRPRP